MVPTAGVVDSRTVKAPAAQEAGYDANKKILGRTRHIAVDTDGHLLAMNLTLADVADPTGAQMVLDASQKRWPWVKHLFCNAAYDRRTLMDKAAFMDFTVEIVRKFEGQQGFAVQHRRWVVERTFCWLIRWCRLMRDYERRVDVSQNMIYIAMGSTLMHRIFFP